MNYHIKKTSPDKVRRLAENFGLDMLTATILVRRGFDDLEALRYFFEEDLVQQHSPFLFEDAVEAVERINGAIEEDEKILIYGDRDTDGITATTIMMKELRRLGARNVSFRLPMHDEAYGLTADVVSEIIEGEYTLLITVDNGISAIEEIGALRELGVDTIVLDHHLAGEEFPKAYALLDPKVEGSGYPFPGLAGCMVAFKCCYALRFSRTPLFESDCILFHATPGNGTVRMNAVRMENLTVTDHCLEEVHSGDMPASESRMIRFLDKGIPILVLDADMERNMMREAFGNAVEVGFNDIRSQVEEVIPFARNKSLFKLSQVSRVVRYDMLDPEMACLISIFRSSMLYRNKSLISGLDDLFCFALLGTIADLMPLTDENRLFVKLGLKAMKTNAPSSLKWLMSKLDTDIEHLSARDISFGIAPVINASGRMGRPDIAVNFLLSEDPDEIRTLADQLIAMNKERQRNTEDAMNAVREQAEESLKYFAGRFIMIQGDVPRGLTGAIASRFLNEFKVPILVLALTEEGRISASMRTKKGFNARGFLENFADLLDDFGGHSCAAGFSMSKDRLGEFEQRVSETILSDREHEEKEEEIEVDAEIPERWMTKDLWRIRDLFEPYGQENQGLKFHLTGAEVYEVMPNRNGGTWLRCTLLINGEIWPAVWWDYDHTVEEIVKGDRVELIFSPEHNHWKGYDKMQLYVHDMKRI